MSQTVADFREAAPTPPTGEGAATERLPVSVLVAYALPMAGLPAATMTLTPYLLKYGVDGRPGPPGGTTWARRSARGTATGSRTTRWRSPVAGGPGGDALRSGRGGGARGPASQDGPG